MKQKVIFLLLSIIMLANDCYSSALFVDGREEGTVAEKPVPVKHLVAIGGAFSDIIVLWPQDDLSSYDAELYAARFLDKEQFLRFKERLIDPIIVPGGSVANAIAIVAQLGGKACFGSTIGMDKEGEAWTSSLNNLGIDMHLHTCESEHTGGCLVFVHPGGQRSMRTYLGTENVPGNDFTSLTFDANSIVFVEGYGLSNEAKYPLYLKAMERAKTEGSYIVVSASDPFCIKNQRDRFISLLQSTADLFIMNEEEARELASKWVSSEGITGDLQACIEFIQTTGKRAVITLGAAGAIAVDRENIWHCSAHAVKVADTLGAGDAFAGGFLHAFSLGLPIPECLQLGSYMAGEVVSRTGARLDGKLESVMKAKEYTKLLIQEFKSPKDIATFVAEPCVYAEE